MLCPFFGIFNATIVNIFQCGMKVKSLEGLEKGNFTTKLFDSFHTYKGDRQKANRGVFKLLRLRSNRVLRDFKTKTKRVQKCSKCKQPGHNSSNKRCPANVDLSEMVEDVQAEDDQAGVVRGGVGEDGDAMNTGNTDSVNEEDFVDIEDLLSSDEELF